MHISSMLDVFNLVTRSGTMKLLCDAYIARDDLFSVSFSAKK